MAETASGTFFCEKDTLFTLWTRPGSVRRMQVVILLLRPNIGLDQHVYSAYRLGIWAPPAPPVPFPGVQFPVDDPKPRGRVVPDLDY